MTQSDIDALTKLADYVFDHAELCFNEYETSRAHCELLEKYGFTVERGVGGLETSYRASFGHGSPNICILAEMDALADMSQEPDMLCYMPKPDASAGHGCGHHLLGAGAIGGAIFAKRYLEESGAEGTVTVMGCPAEENGSGKSILVRAGVFGNVDAAMSWHPSVYNTVCCGATQSYIQTSVSFNGVSSHAAVAPSLGRSALDALELMNDGIAHLREHLSVKQKIHYAITDAGGSEPGVIQPHTEETVLLRAENPHECERLCDWLRDIIKGAALMTQTTYTEQVTESAASVLPNSQFTSLLNQVFLSEPPVTYTDEERAYLQNYKSLSSRDMIRTIIPSTVIDRESLIDNTDESPICDIYVKSRYSEECFDGSTDVGDVSQVCPVGIFNTACFSYGTFPHSWMMVAQGKSSAAHKGMIYGARILGGTAIRLFENPTLVNDLRSEWNTMKEREARAYGNV